jgi:hypothetical protein
MKIKYIFLIGVPGSGKTSCYEFLKSRIADFAKANSKRWNVDKVDDFSELSALYGREREEGLRSFEAMGDTFVVKDMAIYDLALSSMSEKLSNSNASGVRFVEFARPSYSKALAKFSEQITSNAFIIEVVSNLDECRRRIYLRRSSLSSNLDNHYVPEEAFKRFSGSQGKDRAAFFAKFPCQGYARVENDQSLSKLEGEVARLFNEKILPLLK